MLIKYILTKRIQYLFCTNQNYTVYHSVKDRLINYPYSDLNEKVQRIRLESKPKDFLSQNIIEDSIAYAALTEHKQNILINYHKYLFMGIQFQDNVSGADIFIRYFGPKLEQLASTIKNSTNEEQVSYCLKILFYLKSSNYKMDIQKLSLNNIITSCTIDQKAFLLYILSEQKNFLSFIETFNQQFKNSTQERKEKAAFILLSIPNFHKALPSTLCEQSIDIVGEAIHKKTDWQIYRVMQYIFETDYPATRRLADKIMDHLLDKNQDVNNNTKIPVIVKAIKLRDTLKMDNKKFEEKIKDNPLKFNSIFFKKKVNKQPFLQTVASKDSQRILPAEISGLFNSYIIKGLNQIIQSKQCDTDQLAQIIKLSLKFYSNIQNPKLFKIVQQIEILFPMFDQSYEVLFWLMVLLLRIDKNKLKNPQIAKYAYKMIDFYGEQSKRSLQKFQKSKNIEKVVQIYYHIIRCRVMLQNPSKLLEIDFKNVRTFQQIIYSCIIIIHSPLKNEQNYQILCKFNERLSQHLKQNNFKSLKNIYTVLSAMENSKCQAFYKSQDILNLYRSIQKSFMIKLFKQTICPPRKDLIFLKKMYRDVKMPNQEHKHFTKFLNFLSDCLDHPSQFKKHYKAYQQSLKTFNPIQIDPRKKKY